MGNPAPGVDHVAIAVESLQKAQAFYEEVLGIPPEGIEEVPGQGVRVAFFQVGSLRIELLEPTGPESPVAKFLEKRGPGMHHLAFRVEDLEKELARLEAAGVRLIDRKPRPGARGSRIAFLHPKDSGGVLVELCQE